jgi:hypothetical protein
MTVLPVAGPTRLSNSGLLRFSAPSFGRFDSTCFLPGLGACMTTASEQPPTEHSRIRACAACARDSGPQACHLGARNVFDRGPQR